MTKTFKNSHIRQKKKFTNSWLIYDLILISGRFKDQSSRSNEVEWVAGVGSLGCVVGSQGWVAGLDLAVESLPKMAYDQQGGEREKEERWEELEVGSSERSDG